jgi:hypothetical protein
MSATAAYTTQSGGSPWTAPASRIPDAVMKPICATMSRVRRSMTSTNAPPTRVPTTRETRPTSPISPTAAGEPVSSKTWMNVATSVNW